MTTKDDSVIRRGFKFSFEDSDALLRTATVGVQITEPIMTYIEQLARSGLYGNTVESVAERLLVQAIQKHIDLGHIGGVRVDLRQVTR